jgi:16S rRNA (guanine(527)-N(7))-methyltransferase RsmG
VSDSWIAEVGAEADRLGIRLPKEPFLDQLEEHFELMLAWNRKINLTAIRGRASALRLHVLESLAGLELLSQASENESTPLLVDIGSGNGYPALPLLTCRPDLRGLLLEASARKVDFLRAAIRRAGLGDRVTAEHRRVTGPPDVPADSEILTFRAVPDPLAWIERLMTSRRGHQILAWLGSTDADDLSARLLGSDARIEQRRLETRSDAAICSIKY